MDRWPDRTLTHFLPCAPFLCACYRFTKALPMLNLPLMLPHFNCMLLYPSVLLHQSLVCSRTIATGASARATTPPFPAVGQSRQWVLLPQLLPWPIAATAARATGASANATAMANPLQWVLLLLKSASAPHPILAVADTAAVTHSQSCQSSDDDYQ